MSSNRKGLPNNIADARAFVEYITRSGSIDKLYILGSRSPKTKRKPRPESDWDIGYEPTNLHFISPRKTGMLNCCFVPMKTEHSKRVGVEIYPNDPYNILGANNDYEK